MSKMNNRIGGVMVRVLASSVVNCGFSGSRIKPKTLNIGFWCYTAKHAALRKEKEQILVGSESG